MNPSEKNYCANFEDLAELGESDPFDVEETPTTYADTDEVDLVDVASVFETEEVADED